MNLNKDQPKKQNNNKTNSAEAGNNDLVRPSVPEWRSVAISGHYSAGVVKSSADNDIIDKSSFFNQSIESKKPVRSEKRRLLSSSPQSPPSSPCWTAARLRSVPAYYPLERSSRLIADGDLPTVVERVVDTNRLLSVHAVYYDENATASLFTSERVSMHLSLWKVGNEGGEGIVVEIQRRNGDSVAFHKYSRCILDAAAGVLDASGFVESLTGKEQKDELVDLLYNAGRKVLPFPRHLSFDDDEDDDGDAKSEETAVRAIEIADGLLSKDRVDANMLGLESLSVLTDATKTGRNEIASIASRAVLLGTTSMMSALGEDEEKEGELPFPKIRKILLSMIRSDDDQDDRDFEDDDEEHLAALRNLALTVLSNALSVVENEEPLTSIVTPEEVDAASRENNNGIFERLLLEASASDDCSLMKTLLDEVKEATIRPHDSCLSVKCVGSLCRVSDLARSQAKELRADDIVHAAMQVGTTSHYKLERECEKFFVAAA